jgi:hypothetical protein
VKIDMDKSIGKQITFGDKFVSFFELRNRHFLILIPLALISYFLYSEFFLKWFSFEWRFLPTFFLGVFSVLLMLKILKIKKSSSEEHERKKN